MLKSIFVFLLVVVVFSAAMWNVKEVWLFIRKNWKFLSVVSISALSALAIVFI